jgi:hypothetical protein
MNLRDFPVLTAAPDVVPEPFLSIFGVERRHVVDRQHVAAVAKEGDVLAPRSDAGRTSSDPVEAGLPEARR